MGKCYAVRNLLDRMGFLSECTLDEMNDLFDMIEYKRKFTNNDIMKIFKFIICMIEKEFISLDKEFLKNEIEKILYE